MIHKRSKIGAWLAIFESLQRNSSHQNTSKIIPTPHFWICFIFAVLNSWSCVKKIYTICGRYKLCFVFQFIEFWWCFSRILTVLIVISKYALGDLAVNISSMAHFCNATSFQLTRVKGSSVILGWKINFSRFMNVTFAL